jgi:DoxX-like family
MKRVAYWISTGLVVFFIGSGGLAYAMQVPDVVNGVVALGFPIHVIVFLGVGNVVGSIGIAASVFPLAKEWAYTGIMTDLTAASSTAIATGGEWWHALAPLSIAALVVTSWALRPESRRLPGTTIPGLAIAQDKYPNEDGGHCEVCLTTSAKRPARRTRSAPTRRLGPDSLTRSGPR